VNPHLLRDLTDLNLWNDDMKNNLIGNNGSIQNIHGIPDTLKALYKTVWEISQKMIIDLAADRGAFICQSQVDHFDSLFPLPQSLTPVKFIVS
jgi:ribonucleotide reductase alpha subunit